MSWMNYYDGVVKKSSHPSCPEDRWNPVRGECPKCGMKLRDRMMVACSRGVDCPTGLGGRATL